MKFNRLEIKMLVAAVMYALCVGYAFADEWYGFLAGTASGLVKEVYDSTGRGQVSGKDLAVTALGALIGAKGTGWALGPNRVTYTIRINIF